MAGSETAGGDGRGRLNKTALIAGGVMLLIVGSAILGAVTFINPEMQRNLHGWTTRLGLIAYNRTAAANEWIGKNFSDILDLAKNTSLLDYLSELTNNEQAAKLKAAARTGSKAPQPIDKVFSNVERADVAVLGLVDKNSLPAVSTSDEPPFSTKIRDAIAKVLADTDSRLSIILGVILTITVIVTLGVLFIRKKGPSVRAIQALRDAQVAIEWFANTSKFMNVVTDNQPNLIVAVDGDTKYTYANEPAAIEAGIPATAMLGKTMASVIGPIRAQTFADINKSVLLKLEKETHTAYFGNPKTEDPDDKNRFQVVRSCHIPLRGDGTSPPVVLMVISDITELTFEKRRGERMMNQLIDTLISVVDRRDPFSANHSTRVAEVSKAIAREMGMSGVEIKTVETAGKLINLGKIFIPPEILTKTDDLTLEERSQIGNAYLKTIDLIAGVTFEGPVVETICQFGETWDGRGPLGLKAEEIIVTARILAVANAFVGMVSTRAYRSAMPFEESVDILTAEAGTKMDRKAVTALCHYLENRAGMRRWANFSDRPQETDSGDS